MKSTHLTADTEPSLWELGHEAKRARQQAARDRAAAKNDPTNVAKQQQAQASAKAAAEARTKVTDKRETNKAVDTNNVLTSATAAAAAAKPDTGSKRDGSGPRM